MARQNRCLAVPLSKMVLRVFSVGVQSVWNSHCKSAEILHQFLVWSDYWTVWQCLLYGI